MIDSSIPAYGVRPTDPIWPKNSAQSADKVEPQTQFSPVTDTTSQAIITAKPGSILSSGTAAELLKSTDTVSAKSDTVRKPWTITREDVLRAVEESKAYSSGSASAADHLGDKFTPKDVSFIRATTGYNVISIRGLTTMVDDNGNGPPSEILQNSLTQIAGGIEADRSSGVLTGEITPDYATDRIKSYASLIASFPGDWLDNALSYLGDTTDSEPARV